MIPRLTTICLILFLCSSAGPTLAGPPQPDRLSESLDSLGLARERVGTRPEGYWTRFPRPDQIPHLLASFPSLFAEPLRLYDFGRTMGNAAQTYLDPARPDTPSSLHNLIYFLGVEKRVGGFRNYTTNLKPEDSSVASLAEALRELWLRADRLVSYRTFGAASEWQDVPDSQISLFVAGVPGAFRAPLGACIRDLAEAGHWWRVAMRNVPESLRREVLDISDLSDSQGDGTKYYPALDDAVRLLDEHSLYYSGMKCAAAMERLAQSLSRVPEKNAKDWKRVAIRTPLGQIVLGSPKDDTYDEPCLLIVEPRGKDSYLGASGSARGTDCPLSLIVDLEGADRYDAGTEPAQGSAILGCAILYDRSGADRYTATDRAQGYGLLGLGVVYDRAGDDTFEMHTGGQGCGYFGIGLLLDGGGNDSCRMWAEGQGQGGVGGGVGVLAALGGNDVYYAEPDATIAGRADYHSENKITANNVQGSGTGRRGDGSDGHSWAGGLGALLDVGGNDRYEAGNWCQAIGYWFGTGILFDSEGDDVYRSVYFSQASGAHFCNAALLDESGNDRHELWFNRGASIAFGWDYSNILLVDKGGSDLYDGGESCVGLSTGRSHVLLYDAAGDDEYRLNAGSAGLGQSSPRDDFIHPDPNAPYFFYSTSFGMLLDCGGVDKYLRRAADSTYHPDSLAVSGSFWRSPVDTAGGLFGAGADWEGGRVADFYWWDKE